MANINLTQLKSTLKAQVSKGSFAINAINLQNASGLAVPVGLDELLQNSLLMPASGLGGFDLNVQGTGIQFALSNNNQTLTVKGGVIDALNLNSISVEIIFANDSGTLQFTLNTTPTDWNFGQSFPYITGAIEGILDFSNAHLIFSTNGQSGFIWDSAKPSDTINLVVGLNFAVNYDTSNLTLVNDLITWGDSGFSMPKILLAGNIQPPEPNAIAQIFPTMDISASIAGNPRLNFPPSPATPFLKLSAPSISLESSGFNLPNVFLNLQISIGSGTPVVLDVKTAVTKHSNLLRLCVSPNGPVGIKQICDLIPGGADAWTKIVGTKTNQTFLYAPLSDIQFLFFSADLSLGQTKTITSLQAAIGSTQALKVFKYSDFPNGLFEIDSFIVNWTCLNPTSSHQNFFNISAQFQFPEVNDLIFDVSISTEDETVSGSCSGTLTLSSLIGDLNNFIHKTLGVSDVMIPTPFDVSLSDFQILIDQKNKHYTFGATADAELKIMGQEILGVQNAQFMIGVNRVQNPKNKSKEINQYDVNVTGILNLFGIDFDVNASIDTGENPTTNLSIHMENRTLGELLDMIVKLVSRDSQAILPFPWNKLNDINMDALILTLTITNDKHEVSVSYSDDINLEFIDISSFRLSYKKFLTGPNAGTKKTLVSLDCNFFGKSYDGSSNNPSMGWDPINGNPPAVPDKGSVLDVRYLGLGQHISFADSSDTTSMQKILQSLEGIAVPPPRPLVSGLPQSNAAARPLSKIPALAFDGSSSWFIGADISIMNAIRFGLVFNDPKLYGLIVSLSGPKVKALAGLQFEIMYRKINDNIGEYYIELKVPTLMRHIQMGEVSITLPVIGITIYTNGNFEIDFGFPWHNDFSRSFGLQVFPLVGAGGFYFGVLDGATSTQTPAITNGSFDPVIVFGFGLQVGLGKSINEGVLSAEVEIAIGGIMQGVYASFEPDSKALQPATFFKLQGVVAISGVLSGSINFAIIQATVAVHVYADARITYEVHMPMQLGLDVGVSVEVTVKVLFIHVHFSFHATISESYTIGSASPAPWKLTSTQPPGLSGTQGTELTTMLLGSPETEDAEANATEGVSSKNMASKSGALVQSFDSSDASRVQHPDFIASRARTVSLSDISPQAPAVSIDWLNSASAYFTSVPTLELDFVPTPIALDPSTNGNNTVNLVAMLYIENSIPVKGTTPTSSTSFDQLLEAALAWTIKSGAISGYSALTQADASTTAISYKQLEKLHDVIVHGNKPSYGNITDFIKKNFAALNITAFDGASTADKSATVFPMIPELSLNLSSPVTVKYTGTTATSFIGCTGGSGTLHTGQAVTIPGSNTKTTIAAKSNGQTLPLAIIYVESTTGFPDQGALQVELSEASTTDFASINEVDTSYVNDVTSYLQSLNIGTQQTSVTGSVKYTSISATSFSGCTSGSGTLYTGQAVTIAGSNTQTTIAAKSNGQTLPQSVIYVESTTGFLDQGTLQIELTKESLPTMIFKDYFHLLIRGVVQAAKNALSLYSYTITDTATTSIEAQLQALGVDTPVNYTGTTATSFTGCTGGRGTLKTGQAVTLTGGNPTTILSVQSNGQVLPQSIIYVESTAGFPVEGALKIANSVKTESFVGFAHGNKNVPVKKGTTLSMSGLDLTIQGSGGQTLDSVVNTLMGTTTASTTFAEKLLAYNLFVDQSIHKGSTLSLASLIYTIPDNSHTAIKGVFGSTATHTVISEPIPGAPAGKYNPYTKILFKGGTFSTTDSTNTLTRVAYKFGTTPALIRGKTTVGLQGKSDNAELEAGTVLNLPDITYTVAPDSQYYISRYFGVTESDISGTFSAGDTVTITNISQVMDGTLNCAQLGNYLRVSNLSTLASTLTAQPILAPAAAFTSPAFSYSTQTSDTPDAISQRFDVDLDELIFNNLGLFYPTGSKVNVPQATVSVETLMETLKSTPDLGNNIIPFNNVAGQVSRFLLHGLRLPNPEQTIINSNGSINTEAITSGLYSLLGQQFAPGGATSVSLTNSGGVAWVTFKGGKASTPVTTGELAAEISTLKKAKPTLSFNFKAYPLYRTSKPRFTLQHPISWSTPEQPSWMGTPSANGATANPSIWVFPEDLKKKLAADCLTTNVSYTGTDGNTFTGCSGGSGTLQTGQIVTTVQNKGISTKIAVHSAGKTLPENTIYVTSTNNFPSHGTLQIQIADNLSLHTGSRDVTGMSSMTTNAVQGYRWGTLLNLKVRQIKSHASKSGNLSYVYEIEGLKSEAERHTLTALIKAFKGDVNKPTIDFLLEGKGGVVSDQLNSSPVGGDEVRVIKSNLSTIIAGSDQNSDVEAGITSDPLTFLELIWEGSLLHNGGFYLQYQNAQGKGLPDYLFSQGPEANVKMLVLTPVDITTVHNYHNAVALQSQVDLSRNVLFAQADDLTDYHSVMKPGNLGLKITCDAPSAVPPHNPLTPNQKIQLMHNLLTVQVKKNTYFNGSIMAMPAGPVQQPGGDSSTWEFHHLVPISKMAINNGGTSTAGFPDPTMSPYNAVGATLEMNCYFQDIFGNLATSQEASLPLKFQSIGYFDEIISLSRWPGVAASFDFSQPNESSQLNIYLHFDSTRYLPAGQKSMIDCSNLAEKDKLLIVQIYYQLNGPDVNFSAETSMGSVVLSSTALSNGATLAGQMYKFATTVQLMSAPMVVPSTNMSSLGDIATAWHIGIENLTLTNKNLQNIFKGNSTIQQPIYSTVKFGDTIDSICKATKPPIANSANWAATLLDADILHAGTVLTIAPSSLGDSATVYTIQPKDTFNSIAAKFSSLSGVTATTIISNNLTLSNVFQNSIQLLLSTTSVAIPSNANSLETISKEWNITPGQLALANAATTLNTAASVVIPNAYSLPSLTTPANYQVLTISDQSLSAIAIAQGVLLEDLYHSNQGLLNILSSSTISLPGNSSVPSYTPDSHDTLFTVYSYFNDNVEGGLTQKSFINQIQGLSIFKQAVILLPPAQVELNAPVTKNYAAEIFEINAFLTFSRSINSIDAAAPAGVSEITSVTTALIPHMETSATEAVSLKTFAANFEAAFENVKVGLHRKQSKSTGKNQHLWAIPLVESKTAPDEETLTYCLKESSVTYFAPAPLANQKMQRDKVDIYPYRSGVGMSTTPIHVNFTDIDMDLWAKTFLTALHTFTSAEFSAPVSDLDSTAFSQLMQAKQSIANTISKSVITIMDITPDAEQLTAAQESLNDRLLQDLTVAYEVESIIQLEADVKNSSYDVVAAPRLTGKPVMHSYIIQSTDTLEAIAAKAFMQPVSVDYLGTVLKQVPGLIRSYALTPSSFKAIAGLTSQDSSNIFDQFVSNVFDVNGLVYKTYTAESPLNINPVYQSYETAIRNILKKAKLKQNDSKLPGLKPLIPSFDDTLHSLKIGLEYTALKDFIEVIKGQQILAPIALNFVWSTSLCLPSDTLLTLVDRLNVDLYTIVLANLENTDFLQPQTITLLGTIYTIKTSETLATLMSQAGITLEDFQSRTNITANCLAKKTGLFANSSTSGKAGVLRGQSALNFSTAEIALTKDASFLTFLLEKTGKTDSSIGENAVFDFSYKVNALNIESGEETLPGFEDYTNISFVLPFESNESVALDVPIPLRQPPKSPNLISQSPLLNTSSTDLMTLKEWTYQIEFEQYEQAQDEIEVRFSLNQDDSSGRNTSQPEQAADDLFSNLANFISVWPYLEMDLNGLPHLCESLPLDPNIQKGIVVAINSFAEVANKIAQKWSTWREDVAKLNPVSPEADEYRCLIQEFADENRNFGVHIKSLTPNIPSNVIPALQVVDSAGNTWSSPSDETSATDELITYTYLDFKQSSDSQVKLTYEKATQSIKRIVQLQSMDILSTSKVWGALAMRRNQDLINGQTTNPGFIYMTPWVKFINPCIPFINSSVQVDISELQGPDTTKTLEGYLSNLFYDLLELKSAPSTTVFPLTVGCHYLFAVNNNSESPLYASVPVMMHPEYLFKNDDYKINPTTEVPSFVQQMASEISKWYEDRKQVTPSNEGRYQINITLLTKEESPKPFFELTNLDLNLNFEK